MISNECSVIGTNGSAFWINCEREGIASRRLFFPKHAINLPHNPLGPLDSSRNHGFCSRADDTGKPIPSPEIWAAHGTMQPAKDGLHSPLHVSIFPLRHKKHIQTEMYSCR